MAATTSITPSSHIPTHDVNDVIIENTSISIVNEMKGILKEFLETRSSDDLSKIYPPLKERFSLENYNQKLKNSDLVTRNHCEKIAEAVHKKIADDETLNKLLLTGDVFLAVPGQDSIQLKIMVGILLKGVKVTDFSRELTDGFVGNLALARCSQPEPVVVASVERAPDEKKSNKLSE